MECSKKEKRRLANNKYYNKYKSKILRSQLTKIQCPICRCYVGKSNKSKHLKTKKHHDNFDRLFGLDRDITIKKIGKYYESPL